MGLMDELRKLTQPYDEDDDFFDGADSGLRDAPQPSAAQLEFESVFGNEPAGKPEPAEEAPRQPARESTEGGLFGGFARKVRKPQRERTVDVGGRETKVILFNPKTFEEAGELVSHLMADRSLVMTLDGIPNDSARRLLDFMSGITYALQGKITPISAKTYFISPENVDLLGARPDTAETDSQYL
ncbi:MAG: cell division protein SepF [Oscillospiraceae bacterium]|nr:cell division protein SepF [Oscillospiraceae bacterium]